MTCCIIKNTDISLQAFVKVVSKRGRVMMLPCQQIHDEVSHLFDMTSQLVRTSVWAGKLEEELHSVHLQQKICKVQFIPLKTKQL